MLKMAQDLPLARIHGWLAGDGHADARVEPDKHGVHYELRFFPDSKKLAGLFALNFRKRFRVRPHIHDTRGTEECYAVRVRNVTACRLILSVAPLGRHTWPIPSFGYEEEHVQWIKSYYHCACLESTQPVSLSREIGIWVQSLLAERRGDSQSRRQTNPQPV